LESDVERGRARKFASLAPSTFLVEQRAGWKVCWQRFIEKALFFIGKATGGEQAEDRRRPTDIGEELR
jgi:hypothetical protein